MSKFQKLKMTKSTLRVHSRNTPFSSPSSKNSSKENQISQPALKKKKSRGEAIKKIPPYNRYSKQTEPQTQIYAVALHVSLLKK